MRFKTAVFTHYIQKANVSLGLAIDPWRIEMSRTEKRLGVVSIVLIAVLVFTAVFNVALSGGISVAASGADGSTSVVASNDFEKVNMNLDSLKEQYINQSLLQNNIASYDGERWVIVELEGDTLYDKFSSSLRYNDYSEYGKSVEGRRAKANIIAAQQSFISKLDRHGIDYTFKYSYTGLANAVAIKVSADAYNEIKKMSGVVDVYYTETYAVPTVAVTNNANVYTTGIYDSSEIDYKGEGMVVAVLDTGLDYTHEAFAKMPREISDSSDISLGWTIDYIKGKLETNEFNAVGTAEDFYYNEKVPFAYDYADDDPDVYPSYSSHGTHVAGIVAGSSDYIVNGKDSNDPDAERFIGVAPAAQLVIGKVFTDNLDSKGLGGANSMDILAAVDDCAMLGVDVINMSLGTAAGFTDERSSTWITEVYEKVENMGISLIVAASNDYSSGYGGGNGTNLASNPDSGTVGSPSTYSSALSVASINGQKASYFTANNDENQVAFITEASNEFGVSFKFVEELYKVAAKNRGVDSIPYGETLRFKYVVVNGVGKGSDYTTPIQQRLQTKTGYDGTIALIKRGDTTFAEKVQTAMSKSKADACIIYNNVSGTIRMSLGEVENPIPTCSITMDAGKVLLDNKDRFGCGSITVNSDQVAGPFMSEFSSWGPTPDLHLKPEISAHGGEITSAVPGGYDVYSGTSMAAPNMAGAVALLRQHLKSEGLTGKELNERVNQVLMSTATIANNEDGNPYSPRKQGAGLAGIYDAIHAEGYITVEDKETGRASNKTKIELFDDPDKDGVYKLPFTIHNITGEPQTYNPKVYVMTESMSSDGITVAEKAYLLNDNCTITYKVDGVDHTGAVTVPENGEVYVEITITLGAEAKKYLDKNFVNGMYVEGFVSMVAEAGKVTLGLPYLAFYGDWTDAPLFDYDTYELSESELDTNVPQDEKLKASAAETRVLGLYYNDEYILPLGQYIYNQSDDEVKIAPEREKIAVSMYDDTNYGHTIYQIYAVYAGLLRGAAYMDIKVVDAVTGEVKFEQRQENVNKSYAAGGSVRGAFVPLELDPYKWGLSNNSTYYVYLNGEIDYDGGTVAGQNKMLKDENGNLILDKDGQPIHDEEGMRNSFNFQFTADYEAPEMLSYKIRYAPYTVNKVVYYKVWMDVEVKDNQYVQTVLPCYLDSTRLTNGMSTLRLLTQYPIAVYGQKGETSTVSFEITDLYEDYIKNPTSEKQMYIQVEDYALNANTYKIILGGSGFGSTAKIYPKSVDFVEDDYLTKAEEVPVKDDKGNTLYTYNYYDLELASYELYTLKTVMEPADALIKNLTWTGGGKKVYADCDQLFLNFEPTKNSPTMNPVLMSLSDETGKIYARVWVSLRAGSKANAKPEPEKITLNPAVNGTGYVVSLDSTVPELELNPGQSLRLTWTVSPWYCDTPQVTWESNDTKTVVVDGNGNIRTLQRGDAYVTVKLVNYPTILKRVHIVVGDAFKVSSYRLIDFYGSGVVDIPSNRNIMYLDEDCFKGRTDITKVILPTSLTEIPENAFKGCTNLEEVIIPGQCTVIRKGAFEGCTKLKTIWLGQFVDSEHNSIGDNYYGTITIGPNAFKDCSALATIKMYGGTYNEEKEGDEDFVKTYYEINSHRRLTTLHSGAFENCVSLTNIDLSEVRVTGSGVFKGCTNLETVVTSQDTAIGENMFEGCSKLTSITLKSGSIAAYAFQNCANLSEVTFEDTVSYIGTCAFFGTAISEITLPNGNITIGANAFANCASLQTVKLQAGTTLNLSSSSPFNGCNAFANYELIGTSNSYSEKDGVLYNKAETMLISVPSGHGDFDLGGDVTAIGNAAYAGVNSISTVDLSGIDPNKLGNYVFAGSSVETVILPDGLTAIPDGLFYGCSKLVSVTAADGGFATVEKVGMEAFKDCASLTSVSLPSVTVIEESAFENSVITELPSASIEKVGIKAFAGNRALTDITLANATSIGDSAFSNIPTLERVTLGAITEMGEGVFIDSTNIEYVYFAPGTTVVGTMAFCSEEDPVTTAIEIVLPDSVKTIGFAAFHNLKGLTEINLSGVETVYPFAFFDTGLTTADLSNIVTIGESAFEGTKLTSVHLDNATTIGDAAFFKVSTLVEATFGAAEIIGAEAFAFTKLVTVEIPASMNRLTYDHSWYEIDDKGRPELDQYKTRQEYAYGPGAFAEISTLTSITVAPGNEVYRSYDGVLYSVVANGLTLEQYPAAKAGNSYIVEDNTVFIKASAFEGVTRLKSIKFPYTVAAIGAFAFYDSSVNSYTFDSVEAPALLAEYYPIVLEDYSGNKVYLTEYYANFFEFAYRCDDTVLTMPVDFELKLTIPRNATGYDGIWEVFFSTINRTEEDMPSNSTYKAREEIDALIKQIAGSDDIDDITLAELSEFVAGMSSEQIDDVKEYAEDARKAYNKITVAVQITLASEHYEKLMTIEKALRDRKAALGQPVSIVGLQTISQPTKIYYNDGERFDPTGMQLKVIYEDGSEVPLEGNTYIASRNVLRYTDSVDYGNLDIRITYVDSNGVVHDDVYTEFYVTVLNPNADDPDDDPGNNDPGNTVDPGNNGGDNGGNSGLSQPAVIAISVVVPVVVLLAAGIAVLLIVLKKKKAADGDNGDNGNNNNDGDADALGSEGTDEVENATNVEETAEVENVTNEEETAEVENGANVEETAEVENTSNVEETVEVESTEEQLPEEKEDVADEATSDAETDSVPEDSDKGSEE